MDVDFSVLLECVPSASAFPVHYRNPPEGPAAAYLTVTWTEQGEAAWSEPLRLWLAPLVPHVDLALAAPMPRMDGCDNVSVAVTATATLVPLRSTYTAWRWDVPFPQPTDVCTLTPLPAGPGAYTVRLQLSDSGFSLHDVHVSVGGVACSAVVS